MNTSSAPGHLFVTHGDLTQIALDDIIVPCDDRLNVTMAFKALLGDTVPGDRHWIRPAGHTPPRDFASDDRRPLLLPQPHDGPRVWLFNSALSGTGADRESDLNWLISGIQSTFAEIGKHAAPPRSGAAPRARPTIGLPIVGVGEGGFAGMRARVIARLLSTLSEIAGAPGHADIVLVTLSRSDYAAIQAHRPKPAPPRMVEESEVARLAGLAREGNLVAFLGSGIGRSAGLPDWSGLLGSLAKQTSWDEALQAEVLALPPEDAAEALSKGLGNDPRRMQALIVEAVRAKRYGLAHSLLASIRMRESVTTNYDDLFEQACATTLGDDLRVLPRQRVTGRQPWLLKLHGDTAEPDSIVLTRSQYLALEVDSVPLASVVQANMVTRHMMFVGYSLSDTDFIRLAHQVQSLFTSYKDVGGPIGTVLTLDPRPAQSLRWEDTLRFLPVAAGDAAEGSRQTEILLDCIGHASCDEAPYLLDSRYHELLTDSDQRLAEALAGVRKSARPEDTTPAWARVRRLLAEFGGSTDES